MKLKKSKTPETDSARQPWLIGLINGTFDEVVVDLRIKTSEVPK